MATKNYFIGPQDGWTQIIDTAGTFNFLRVSAVPHTHPFYVYADPADDPTVTDVGVLTCHHPFKVVSAGTGDDNGIWIRVKNPVPNSAQGDGRLRIDVYTDTGTLI